MAPPKISRFLYPISGGELTVLAGPAGCAWVHVGWWTIELLFGFTRDLSNLLCSIFQSAPLCTISLSNLKNLRPVYGDGTRDVRGALPSWLGDAPRVDGALWLPEQYQHPVLLLPLTADVLLSAGAGDCAGTGFHSLVSSRLRVRSTYLRTYG